MYVTSVSGLRIYDISDPAAPAEVGALGLPHFENEDVDLGGDILLISNDAAESTGILYVIDISNPTAPAIASTFPMGGDPVAGGPGHTASCIKDCQFAWVTDTGGIRVIDLSDPDSAGERRHLREPCLRRSRDPRRAGRRQRPGMGGRLRRRGRLQDPQELRRQRTREDRRPDRRARAQHLLRRVGHRRRLEPQRLHPAQLASREELERPVHHGRGLQPAGLQGGRIVRDVARADRQEGQAQRAAR